MTSRHDIVIAGSGPAGLALAASCVQAGLSVAVVSTDPEAAWTNGYGLWFDDVDDPELARCTAIAWNHVAVRFGAEETNYIQRPYGRVDNAALQSVLRNRASGARFERGEAQAVVHDAAGATLQTSHGTVRGAVVVDATGRGHLAGAGAATAFQTAWGIVADTDDLDPCTPLWMDHTPIPGDDATFLYALPLGGSRWLLEETSLVRRPPVAVDRLRERLGVRLAQQGIRVGPTQVVERVVIPMNTGVPRRQRVVAFGAAAGMVHPSTGYLLGRVLAEAPAVANALARGLWTSPEAASNAAWTAIWPAARLRQRALHLYGAEVIGRLDAAQTAQFFRSFFRLPPETVRGWLADTLPPEALAMAMASMFPTLPLKLRWKAASGGRLRHLMNAALGWQP